MSHSSEPVAARRRVFRRPLLVGGIAAAILTAFVLLWFQPQKLVIDDRVNEAAPGEAVPGSVPGSTGGAEPDPATSRAPVELARGRFVSLDHATTGTARLLRTEPEVRVLRLEEFETENGPDLYVYLTMNRADGPQDSFDEEFINLGRLKGNQGDQNYDLPDDADLSRLRTVVIWCDRFNSPFGAADLSAS